MAIRKNLLRERLNAGKPTVGTHILSAWPTLAADRPFQAVRLLHRRVRAAAG
jgi:hypothetical protein